MVHATLNLALDLAAGNANVLEKVVSAISSDAVVTVSGMPADPDNLETLLTLFQKIEFRNLNSASGQLDDIRFRISETNYSNFSKYMTDVFTPTWANSNAATQNKDNAIIRAAKNNANTDFTSNNMEMTVTEGSVAAPGNFNGSVHGCFPDLHIGYVAAALTNAHEGRAVILNEESVFDEMNSAFGDDFMSSLWGNADPDSGGTDYRQLDLEGNSAGPLKELLTALYHQAPDRFQASTPNDTEEFQALPIEAADKISIKVTVSGGLSMSKASLDEQSNAKAILANVTEVCQATPATFQKPVDHDGVEGVVGSNDNMAESSSSVSVQLRSQIYEVEMTL